MAKAQAPPREARAAENLPARATPRGFPALIESATDRIRAVLPASLKGQAERFAKVAAIEFSRNPDLANCEPMSILVAVVQAAEMGLEVGKPHDYAHLVPFGGRCELLIDYKGYLVLARRTREFAAIDARLVHARDDFALEYDPEPRFLHRPFLGADRGAVTHSYAYAKLVNGETVFEVMTRDEVEHVRSLSRSKNSPPWRDHWGEMARKVPLKRMLKKLPRSTEMALASAIDDSEYADSAPRPALAGPTASARLARQLAPPPAEEESQESPVMAEDVSQEPEADDEPWPEDDDGVASGG